PRKSVGRHHLLDIFHDEVYDRPLQGTKHIPELRNDDVFDVGVADDLFQVAGKVGHDDNGDGTRVAELMFHFTGGVQRICVDDDEARPEGTEECNRELQTIGHLDSDPVTLFQAEPLLQKCGEVSGELVDLPEGKPDAHVFVRN